MNVKLVANVLFKHDNHALIIQLTQIARTTSICAEEICDAKIYLKDQFYFSGAPAAIKSKIV
jgi:hypothetical protein